MDTIDQSTGEVTETNFQAPERTSQFGGRGMAGINAGAVSIESERAVAEARGQMQLAKMFPRDEFEAYEQLMKSCAIMAMASAAFYSVPRGGGQVTGASIRFAEECARVLGNMDYGHRELSRDDAKSEVEVFAWDKQTNVRRTRQITVMHVIDTKQGPKKINSQKDIDDLIANKASKQMRSLILSLVPVWMKDQALTKCKETLAAGGDKSKKSIPERVRDMLKAFSPYGVGVQQLEKYIEHSLEEATVDDLADLHGVFTALKEGAKVAEYFGAKEEAGGADTPATDVEKAAKAGAEKRTAAAAAAKATAKPAAQETADPKPKEAKATETTPADPPAETTAEAEADKPAPAAEATTPEEPAAEVVEPEAEEQAPAAEEQKPAVDATKTPSPDMF